MWVSELDLLSTIALFVGVILLSMAIGGIITLIILACNSSDKVHLPPHLYENWRKHLD